MLLESILTIGRVGALPDLPKDGLVAKLHFWSETLARNTYAENLELRMILVREWFRSKTSWTSHLSPAG